MSFYLLPRQVNLDDVPSVQCDVLSTDGPAALFVCVPAEGTNTGDFSIDFPLCAGSANDRFLPNVLGLGEGCADHIEASQTLVLGRKDTLVALPAVSLADEGNQDALYQRLCLAFTDGRSMPHVWQVALAAILHTLETKLKSRPGCSRHSHSRTTRTRTTRTRSRCCCRC